MWRTEFDVDRRRELERFARDVSAPMFGNLDGCLGYVYAVSGSTWITQTFWESLDRIEQAETSRGYQDVVRAIVAAGFLGDPQTVEVFEVVGLSLPD